VTAQVRTKTARIHRLSVLAAESQHHRQDWGARVGRRTSQWAASLASSTAADCFKSSAAEPCCRFERFTHSLAWTRSGNAREKT